MRLLVRLSIGSLAVARTDHRAFAAILQEKTRDVWLAQQAPGHRQITTSEISARADNEAVNRAVRAIGRTDFSIGYRREFSP